MKNFITLKSIGKEVIPVYECPNCGHRQDHPGPCDQCGKETERR
ncbi:hypothetical protein HMPREF1985_02352 [Mitsuokella sp. oral taxon 131 str. W9106]|nr:hypothetical protein HMPREF1985_02352 [Mitsuokella sp. oral taxon 131 str. W9106]